MVTIVLYVSGVDMCDKVGRGLQSDISGPNPRR